jgi:N-acetylglucosamine-6-sulfatase
MGSCYVGKMAGQRREASPAQLKKGDMRVAERAPRSGYWRLLLAAMLSCLFVSITTSERQPLAQEVNRRPNVLFILTDDQDPESLARMANVKSHLVHKGTRFINAFVTTPECCPSRVSFMRGQYVHNHGVLSNMGPKGGYDRFIELGLQRSTVATWLHDAGYATFYAGKFMNGYVGARYVPPGWDKWYAFSSGVDQNYTVNENGALKTYTQDQQHETYYLRDRAEAFIRNHKRGAPWFAWVSTHAPHGPQTIAPKFRHSYDDAKMPRPPSYNEANVSDKPKWIRNNPRLDSNCSTDEGQLDCHQQAVKEWRDRQEALKSVDVMANDLIKALVQTNQMDRTYIVFASDNGYLLYRHRAPGKAAPYEESQGIPFVVRGPGVQRGVVSDKLVANIDLAPTIAEWAGIQPPGYVDGRSLVPILEGTATSLRQRLLFELSLGYRHYSGVRTADGETYVEYESGEKENYDLRTDPWQLKSGHADRENAQRIGELSARLSELKTCARASCRSADGGP